MNINIIIPAFNEEENLKILLPQLHSIVSSCCSEYEFLVIDSKNSADKSEYICKINNTRYFVQNSYGYADVFITGINKADGKAILIVDTDNSQDISKIPLMYEAFNQGFGVVIDSRYVKGATTNVNKSVKNGQ